MYVQEGGYETDPTRFTNRVNQLVDMATARGLYSVIDFHTLTPADPNYNLQRAKTFFSAVSARDKDNKGVIYEIANKDNYRQGSRRPPRCSRCSSPSSARCPTPAVAR